MTPQQIGKYTITAVLGEGAMGVVYKGFDPGIQRVVAIKTVRKALLAGDRVNAALAARFRNEAQAVGRLSHPGIIAIYEYGETGDNAFIAMEYAEGRNLADVLAETPLLPEADVLSLMDQLLDALDSAHRHGVWHRDIKPANLIVSPAGRLKVGDFGVARIKDLGLTQTSTSIGTPGYMAPEQYLGTPIDQRVDVFAAGVLLYRLLAGEQPFTGRADTVMYKILNEDPLPPSQRPGLRRAGRYDHVVAMALAKKADQRYASAGAFRQALAGCGTAGLADRSDATTMFAVAPRAGPAAAEGTAGSPAAVPDSLPPLTTGTRERWDAAALARFEHALARHIGPLAKVLVRQAASRCADPAALAAALAEHITAPEERSRFIARMTGPATPTGTGSLTGTGTGLPPATDRGVAALPEAVLAHALRVLTQHMGPIAKIVVKQAAARASRPDELFQRLAEEAPAGPQRDRLLAELQRMPPG